MRRSVFVAAAVVALFAAGFALGSSELAVKIDHVDSRSTGLAFTYSANETADFSCTLDGRSGACGASTTVGSITYEVPTGTHTFVVEASNADASTTYTGTASTTVDQRISSILVPPPPPSTVTVTETSTSTVTSTETRSVTVTSTVPGPTRTVTQTVTETSSSTVAWAVVLGVAGGALLAAAVTYWLVRRRRLRPQAGRQLEGTIDIAADNARWQLKAKDGPPPRHCKTGERICQKECEASPALRRVTGILLNAVPDGDGTTVHGEAVELLNDAREAQRKGRPRDAAFAAHEASRALGGAIASFARYATEALHVDVAVALEGGDASCKFTLLRCVNEGGDSPWRPERDWTAKAKDSKSVHLGGVDASSARGAEGQEYAAGLLEALLAAFVTDR